MTDAERSARELVRPEPPLGLPKPALDGRSLANIAAWALAAAGGELREGTPLAPPLSPELDPFDGRRAEGPTVLVLVDGMGWVPFARWIDAGSSPAARVWGEMATPITTVFPTTTVSALTSLMTGTAPGRHGVVGALQYLPKLGRVVDVLRMTPFDELGTDRLAGPDWRPGELSAAPSVFARGLEATVLTRHQFRGTGLTRLLYEGAEFAGYATASDLLHLLVEVLGRARPPPFVLVYWDELDTVQHLRGDSRPLFEFEVERAAHLLGEVARLLEPRRARSVTVAVTADHGQVPVAPDRQVRVDQIPEVVAELAHPFSGDRRAGYFAARPGRSAALRSALEAHLPGFPIFDLADVVAAGWFGPPPHHPELRHRLGDLLVLPPVPRGLLTPRLRAESRSPEFLGSHSGLEAAELLVPWVRGSLATFGLAAPSTSPAR